jgi:hypothetical protein
MEAVSTRYPNGNQVRKLMGTMLQGGDIMLTTVFDAIFCMDISEGLPN